MFDAESPFGVLASSPAAQSPSPRDLRGARIPCPRRGQKAPQTSGLETEHSRSVAELAVRTQPVSPRGFRLFIVGTTPAARMFLPRISIGGAQAMVAQKLRSRSELK